MKRSIVALPIFTAIVLTGCQANTMPSATPVSNATLEQTVNQTLIIMFNDTVNRAQLDQMIARYHATITHEMTAIQGVAIYLPKGSNIDQAIADFKSIKGVTTVERDSIQTIQ